MMQSSFRAVLRLTSRASTSPEQPVSVEATRSKRSGNRRFLRKSDLEDKLVITRTSGRKFGSIGEAWVEPRRLRVLSFDITTTQPFKTELRGSVDLQTIREVGDVVLVHSDQDLRQNVLSDKMRLMAIPGLKLVLDNGTVVGRCVDFVFDPENGRIAKLIFHTVNLPFAKRKWFDQYTIPVQEISRIVMSERIIYLTNEASWSKVGVGEYQFLANLLPSFQSNSTFDDPSSFDSNQDLSTDLQRQYQQLLNESRRQQEAYYAKYGRQPSPRQRSLPQAAPPRPMPRRRNVRMDEWLKKEERREELFMQE